MMSEQKNIRMSNRILYILSILFLFPFFLLAQAEKECSYAIQGKVFQLDTKEPLGFVSVQLENTSIGATRTVYRLVSSV